MKNRTLFFGDNLDILRDKFPGNAGYFDLIYLDPPFNSNRNYNVLFKEGISENHAQVQAFEDSWHWTREAEKTFEELVGTRQSITPINQNISELMTGFEKIVGRNDVMAYLVMMTMRLIELHRVLKPTGSIYLHCDSTASHYLKIVMDAIFDKHNFRNEIVWKRSSGFKRSTAKKFPQKHDILLFYVKSREHSFKTQYIPHDPKYLERFRPDATGRLCRTDVNPTKGGRRTIYLDDVKGNIVDSVWTDINPVNPVAKERLGYQTQKPEKLLERIISASSKEGDWILDPFCGCGTTVAVAEKLNRNWVGIDITTLAINLVKHRLLKEFDVKIRSKDITIDGLPKDLEGAEELFHKDPFEFEYWALDLVNAMPARSKSHGRMRGADRGVDGIITFKDTDVRHNPAYKKIVVQVKGGKVQRGDIAKLKGDAEREKAEAGLLVTLEEPTRPMVKEVNASGSFRTVFPDAEFPKMQIMTIKDLLDGKKPDLPRSHEMAYYKKAQRASKKEKDKQATIRETTSDYSVEEEGFVPSIKISEPSEEDASDE